MRAAASQRDGTPGGGRVLSRKDFMKIGGAGLAGIALLGVARPAFAQAAEGPTVSVLELGISPNNDGITNRENLVKALRYSKRRVFFPPGDYMIDNSKTQPERGLNHDFYVVINGYEGELLMEEGARFVFTDNTRRGLFFHEGTGARFVGLRTAFEERPPLRVGSEECVTFTYTNDTEIRDADVDGAAASGLLFWHCIRPSVSRTTIKDTMADGLHFANCQDARADDIRTSNTGDDALVFLNYADSKDYSGGYATNITVEDSMSRGIAVIGQDDVTIDGFSVDRTNSSGLLCSHDAYWGSRVSSNTLFMNGEVRNAGFAVDPAGKTGNRYGIEIDAVESAEFKDIKVFSSATKGVSGVAARKVYGAWTQGAVSLTNIEVEGASGSGFELQGTAHDVSFAGGTYQLANLSARDVGRAGFFVARAKKVNYGKLTSIGASKNDSLKRAFWFQQNERVEGTQLDVVDEAASPTGFKVVAYRDKSGHLGKVYDRVAHGEAVVENDSGLNVQMAAGDMQDPAPVKTNPGVSAKRRRLRLQKLRRRRLLRNRRGSQRR